MRTIYRLIVIELTLRFQWFIRPTVYNQKSKQSSGKKAKQISKKTAISIVTTFRNKKQNNSKTLANRITQNNRITAKRNKKTE